MKTRLILSGDDTRECIVALQRAKRSTYTEFKMLAPALSQEAIYDLGPQLFGKTKKQNQSAGDRILFLISSKLKLHNLVAVNLTNSGVTDSAVSFFFDEVDFLL